MQVRLGQTEVWLSQPGLLAMTVLPVGLWMSNKGSVSLTWSQQCPVFYIHSEWCICRQFWALYDGLLGCLWPYALPWAWTPMQMSAHPMFSDQFPPYRPILGLQCNLQNRHGLQQWMRADPHQFLVSYIL